MNKYVIYEHWRPDTNACFYVGLSRVAKRPYDMVRNRNVHHKRIVAKLAKEGLSTEVRVVETGLSKEEAVAAEIRRIAHYGRENLTNMTAGGDGVAELDAESKRVVAAKLKAYLAIPESRERLRRAQLGRKHTEETRAKVSAALRRRIHSEETKLKRAAAHIGSARTDEAKRNMSVSHMGMRRTPESIAKQRATLLARGPRSNKPKAVVCLDDGRYFPSATSAAAFVGVTKSTMGRHLLGKRLFCAGKQFCYEDVV